jgi:hypothetical protein
MTIPEARYLFKDYVGLQRFQQATRSHVKLLAKTGIPNDVMKFIANNTTYIRKTQFIEIFDIWTDKYPEARWVKSINGFGPAISTGLLCYLDIDKARNTSSFWRRAGLIPHTDRCSRHQADQLISASMDRHGETNPPTEAHIKWICEQTGKNFAHFHKFCRKKDQPYNWNKIYIALVMPKYSLELKQVCNMIGDQVIKNKNLYHDLYVYRRKWEEARNEAGEYKSRAEAQLQKHNYKPWKEPYKTYITGKLPPSHIIARSKRWAIKIFLAHYYSVIYSIRNDGKVPYDAYALDILKGQRQILVPNLEKISE